jgi:hypothetical protein
MARYFVYDGSPLVINSLTSSGVIQGRYSVTTGVTAAGNYAVGDVVYYKGTYGVITQVGLAPGTTITVGYDDRIYTAIAPGAATMTIYNKPTGDTTIDDLYSYTIDAEVVNAFYSERLIRYNSSEKFYLTIDNYKREFLNKFRELLKNDSLFLVDDCTYLYGVVYKVAMEEDTFTLVNNSFKKEIKFRIATK